MTDPGSLSDTVESSAAAGYSDAPEGAIEMPVPMVAAEPGRLARVRVFLGRFLGWPRRRRRVDDPPADDLDLLIDALVEARGRGRLDARMLFAIQLEELLEPPQPAAAAMMPVGHSWPAYQHAGAVLAERLLRSAPPPPPLLPPPAYRNGRRRGAASSGRERELIASIIQQFSGGGGFG